MAEVKAPSGDSVLWEFRVCDENGQPTDERCYVRKKLWFDARLIACRQTGASPDALSHCVFEGEVPASMEVFGDD